MDQLAPETVSAEADSPDLPIASPVEKAAMGDSLASYRQAKALEAAAPPEVPESAATAAPTENRKTRQEKADERQREAIRRAVEDATTALRAENTRLQQQTRPAQPPAPAPATAAAPTQKDYQRYLALPDAPKEADFTDYKEFTAAVALHVSEKRAEERQASQARTAQLESQRQRDFTRFDKVHVAFNADPELADIFQVIKATNQVPTNSPISLQVLSLKPFAMLGKDEQPSSMNAIAEELLDSDHPVGLAKLLSKNGNAELKRLAALPDARSLIREIGRLEDSLKSPAPVLETQAGTPATSLTTARATDPLDPVESALRSGNQSAYKKARTQERLRAAGLLK